MHMIAKNINKIPCESLKYSAVDLQVPDWAPLGYAMFDAQELEAIEREF